MGVKNALQPHILGVAHCFMGRALEGLVGGAACKLERGRGVYREERERCSEILRVRRRRRRRRQWGAQCSVARLRGGREEQAGGASGRCASGGRLGMAGRRAGGWGHPHICATLLLSRGGQPSCHAQGGRALLLHRLPLLQAVPPRLHLQLFYICVFGSVRHLATLRNPHV